MITKEEVKEISVDFYSIHIAENSQLTFIDVMNKFLEKNKTTEDKNYSRYEGDDILRLGHFHHFKDDVYLGKWVKLKKGIVPKIDSIDKEDEKDIELSEGQHIIDIYYFIYVEGTRILVAARNRDARSINRFAAYLRDKTEFYGLQFKPKIKSDAYERLRKASDIHRFSVNFVADPAVTTLDKNDPVYKIAALREVFGGLKFTLIIEGSKDNAAPIKKDAVIASAQTYKNGFIDFNKFQVEGPPAEDLADSLIDFVHNRFGDTIKIKYTGKVLPSQIYNALLSTYRQRINDLCETKNEE